ncbi:MAG: PAS domain S-box protein, partial [Caldimonas sp.]
MSAKVARTVWAGVTIGIVLLVVNLALSVANTRTLRQESTGLLRSNELLLALDGVLTLVVDAETGQRGFVITGQPEYLAPYRNAVASIQTQMDKLQALTAEDPVLQSSMADIRHHIGARLGELDLTIALRQRKGFDLTKEVIALGSGQADMNALRAAVAAMTALETRALTEREDSARKTYRYALVSEVVSGLAAVLALLGFGVLLARYLAARDRNEAMITSQREQLKTTLASIGDAVITTDAQSRVTDLNRVAERLTGWSRADAEGQPLAKVFRIIDETSREPIEIPTDRALREGIVVGLASRTLLVRRDGSEAPIDDSAAPIRDSAGHVLGSVLVFRDISARKATERELGDARARLELIVTDMAIPTMVYTEDGAVRLVNRAWTAISGYSAGELATLSDWVSRAYGRRAPMMAHVVRSLFELDHSVDNGEREITTASGEKRIWHFITAPLGRDERGRRMLVTNAVDVTERGRLDRLLAESEARLRLTMEAANFGSWQYDPQTGETVWTDKTRELMGATPDEPVIPGLLRALVHPDDLDGRREAIAAALASGVYHREFRVVRRDGEVRWLSSRGRSITDPKLGVRLIGLIGDITEQKRAVEALQDADRRKDEFFAALAHELRNPLAPLRNSLAVVQRSAPGTAAFEKASAVMERQLSQLVRLIDDLLDVGRMNLDRLVLRWEVVELAPIVEQATESCGPAAAQAGVTLTARVPDEPLRLRADRARLLQVFVNLVGNACKFTPRGGHVEIVAQRRDGQVEIAVRDDGIGIAGADLERVFEMFAQVGSDPERTRDGLGIGLALVRRLVELHGGSIVATSDGPGRGSTFTVSLPIPT